MRELMVVVHSKERSNLQNCSFPWSSYAAVTGLKSCSRWIDRAAVLEKYSGTLREKQAAYTRFVQEGLLREIENPVAAATAGAILGSPAFIERIRREFTNIVEKMTQRHELIQEQRVASWIGLTPDTPMVSCPTATLLSAAPMAFVQFANPEIDPRKLIYEARYHPSQINTYQL